MANLAVRVLGLILGLALGACGSEASPDPEPTGCAPAGALSTGPRQFGGSAADSKFLYVGDYGGTLRRIRQADGKAETLAQTPEDYATDCALDGGTLYCAASRVSALEAGGGCRVFSIGVAGGAALDVATGLDFLSSLAVDATHLYWVTQGTRAPGQTVFLPNGKLQRIAKAGGPVETLASGLALPVDLALDAEHVYIAALGGTQPAGRSGLLRVAKAGGPPTRLADVPAARALAVDEAFVYFTTGGSVGAMARAPKGGGAVERVYAGGLEFPGKLLLRGERVYFVSNADGDGSVHTVDKARGAPVLLEEHLNAPLDLTLSPCGVIASLDREVRLLREP